MTYFLTEKQCPLGKQMRHLMNSKTAPPMRL